MEEMRTVGKNTLSSILEDDDVILVEEAIWENSNELSYKRNLYQIIGDVMNEYDLDNLLKRIESNQMGWDHHSFIYERDQINDQDDFVEHPFEVEEGVIECRCGSKKVYSYSKQTRSADEPMTTYAECAECNSKWQYSG